jgi:hypothetical protein
MTGRGRGETALIAALAAGASVQAAARAGGLSERTVYRRLEDPAFRKSVNDARTEIVSRSVAKLSAASTEAAETLRKLLYSDKDFTRLAAARTILELGARLREQQELTERIAALEEQLAEHGPTTKRGRSWAS